MSGYAGVKNKAFTLVELLLVMIIMSYLGAVLYEALYTSIRGVSVVSDAFRLPRMVLMASRLLERELTGIYLPEETAFTPPEETEETKETAARFLKEKWVYGLIGKEREMHFTTIVPLSEPPIPDEETEKKSLSTFDKKKEEFPLADILKLSYEFDRDEKKLKKRISPIPDDKLDKGGMDIELNLWLSEVKFSYYDKKWESSWDSRSAGKLPRAIKLSLEFTEPVKQDSGFLSVRRFRREKSEEDSKFKHEMIVLLPNAADNRRQF